jgi:hypothetical protein
LARLRMDVKAGPVDDPALLSDEERKALILMP